MCDLWPFLLLLLLLFNVIFSLVMLIINHTDTHTHTDDICSIHKSYLCVCVWHTVIVCFTFLLLLLDYSRYIYIIRGQIFCCCCCCWHSFHSYNGKIFFSFVCVCVHGPGLLYLLRWSIFPLNFWIFFFANSSSFTLVYLLFDIHVFFLSYCILLYKSRTVYLKITLIQILGPFI